MGILENLLAGALHLVVVAIDVVAFFFIVRLLVARWPIAWLKALDGAGTPLVDGLYETLGKRVGVASFHGASKALIAMLVLLALGAMRMALTVVVP